MSMVSTPLPLPLGSEALEAIGRADLLTTWDAINGWHRRAMDPNEPGLEHYGGPIMLAVKYLREELSAMKNSLDQAGKIQIARLLTPLLSVAKWLFFKGAIRQVTLPDAESRLRHCLAIYQLIRLFIAKHQETGAIKGSDAKQRVQNLETQIRVQLPEAGQSTRKRGRPSEEVSSGRENPPGGNTSGNAPASDVMVNLAISQADRAQYLDRYDLNIGVVPVSGLTKSPMVISMTNMLSLSGKQWLDDAIIDAYLGLVCHEGNGHFNATPDSLPQSPKWHAWYSGWLTSNDHSASWPPPVYPIARIQDVAHHFFPRHVPGHWVMYHLWKEQGSPKWQVEFLSSLPGYKPEDWPAISGGLLSLDEGLNVTDLRAQIPKDQPMQRNSNDCGVLVICAARWRMEGWPLGSLRQRQGPEGECHHLRERLIVELEKWRLRF